VPEEKPRTGQTAHASSVVRFGPYELDLRSAELRKNHLKIRLQEQPFQILVALLERPGELVLREEIRQKLWPDETVVEFDHSINAAVKRLRDALCESAEKPRNIETLARRGYRFIGKVESAGNLVAPNYPVQVLPLVEDHPMNIENGRAIQPKHKNWWIAASALAIVVLAAGAWVTPRRHSKVKLTAEMTRLTFDSGLTTDPAVSPDGKLLAYASDRNGNGRLHIWVQQFLPDGQAVQLTHGDADEHQPAFSPDGSKVAFRSERDGGGIYVIPAIGGESTFIAKDGRDPRFSPDGRWIAYWQTNMVTAPWVAGAGTVYLVPSAGGPPQPVRSNLAEAGVPEWSEDGKRLIVFGCKDSLPFGNCDWWVAPVDGGSATSIGAFSLLWQRGFTYGPDVPRVASWRGDALFFVARHGDTTNVWKVRIAGANPRVTGDPERLTSGTSVDAYPSLTRDGRLLFASLTHSRDVWILPSDANAPKPAAPMRRVTETAGPHQFASLSADGKLLAYSSMGYGRQRVWIKNLESGAETPATSSAANQGIVQLSPDGSLLAYTTSLQNGGAGFVVPVRGGTADQFCTNCGTAYDLSPDNKVVLYRKESAIRAFNLLSRRDSLFMQSAKYGVFQHKFSPDGRWLTFEAVHDSRSQLYIAAVRDNRLPAPENEWIPITGDKGWADKPRWSPDGNLIYFISNQDGFFCLWAQRVAPDSKQPIGSPLSIAHFHGSRLSIANVGAGGPMEISVARDKIALNLGELTGNIWATDLSR
jgi:eukaryotic-like serine/threonine-protein kinase